MRCQQTRLDRAILLPQERILLKKDKKHMEQSLLPTDTNTMYLITTLILLTSNLAAAHNDPHETATSRYKAHASNTTSSLSTPLSSAKLATPGSATITCTLSSSKKLPFMRDGGVGGHGANEERDCVSCEEEGRVVCRGDVAIGVCEGGCVERQFVGRGRGNGCEDH